MTRQAWTIDEFCQAHGISRATFYNLQKHNMAPRVMHVGARRLVSEAAAATEVYTMNLDGTGVRQVTKFGDSQLYVRDATISADGTTIAFVSNYSVAGRADANQIWTVKSDGTGLTMLSGGSNPASNPSISLDGSTVTFLQNGQIRRARTVIQSEPIARSTVAPLIVSASAAL